MKIAIDLQGCQSDGNFSRGIGRYSLSLIKSLIINSSGDEFILIANSSLNDLRGEFSDLFLSRSKYISYLEWSGVSNSFLSDKSNLIFYQISQQLRSYLFSKLNVDLILVTSFFDGFHDNSITPFYQEFSLPPVFCIIHDLIPLVNSKDYLDDNPDYKEFYNEKLKQLSDIDYFFTNSKSTAIELNKYLPIHKNRIKNISSGCDHSVFLSTNNEFDKSIFRKLGKFILYCGAMDVRKNVRRLIRAYSNLSKEIKLKYKLVFVGKLTEEEVNKIRQWSKEETVNKSSIVILGYVPDDQLVALYNNCSLFVLPSIHEGFGLPVLEAMSCGAPVIGSNVTSIPEVIGLKDALFDPFDVTDMTRLISTALSDIDFNYKLRKNSIQRSKLFSWDQCAFEALKYFIQKVNNYCPEKYEDLGNCINNNDTYKQLCSNIATIINQDNSNSINDSHLTRLSASIDRINIGISKLNKSYQFDLPLRWRVEGPFDSTYSLAILNRQFVLALLNQEQKVDIRITEGNGDYHPNYMFLKTVPKIHAIYEKSIKNSRNPTIISRNLYPPRTNSMGAPLNMLHAYGWEESQFPLEWSISFNQNLDCITVMSEFVKKILIDNGVSIPINVCHLGVSHINEFEYVRDFKLKAKKFRFLHISSCFPRKGVDCLLESYAKAFTNNDDVTLVIKTFDNPHNDVQKKLDKFRQNYIHFPDVVVIKRDLSQSEIKGLYQSCDALVSPSHGEGFGLPIAEAMLMKLPVITNGWGGQMDFCNTQNSWVIGFDFDFSKTHFGFKSSVWAVPSISDCARLMREVYFDNDSVKKLKIEAAYTMIKNSKFHWDSVAKKNIEFVNDLKTYNLNSISRIGWVSPWNTRCGIASYSENLVNQIEDYTIVLAPRDEEKLTDDSEYVRRCWSLSDSDLDSLYDQIVLEKLTTVVFQFNYGFYNFTNFSDLIEKLFVHDIKVIIFLHSTIDPSGVWAKQLKNIQGILSRSTRILVHTPADMNRLKKLGLVDNVTLFPHGVLDYTPPNNLKHKLNSLSLIRRRSIHLSTFGFCLPNKGFIELIRSIPLLIAKDYDVKLDLLTSIYSEQYKWFYYELKKLVSTLGLKKFIDVNSHYLSNKESLDILSSTDLIVYPYQMTNESSSAAVRHGLASGTPVAVTPLNIFDDVSEVVHYLPGIKPLEIANGIINWYENDKDLTLTKEEWLDQHRFSTLGLRLNGMIRSLEIN